MECREDADRALVDAAAAGSREAFDELVRRYQTSIITLARVLTSGSGEAEDLAQEIFVRAWRSIGRFRGESTFRTWLHRIAINVVRTHQTQQGRWFRIFRPPGSPRGSNDERVTEPAASDAPVDVHLVRRQIIDRALRALPADLRLAVTLRDLQGLEYREIAQ